MTVSSSQGTHPCQFGMLPGTWAGRSALAATAWAGSSTGRQTRTKSRVAVRDSREDSTSASV